MKKILYRYYFITSIVGTIIIKCMYDVSFIKYSLKCCISRRKNEFWLTKPDPLSPGGPGGP